MKNITKIDFMGYKNLNYFISLLLVLLTFVSIYIYKFNIGIDFAGGTVIELKLSENKNLQELYTIFENEIDSDVTIQNFDDNNIMIKIGNTPNMNYQELVNLSKKIIYNFLGENVEIRKIDYVGPSVGTALIYDGVVAVLLAFLGIMLYVAFRFEWQYGIGILIALFHDTIVTLGFVSFFNIEFNLNTIAAILTIIGYSVNDSVVIYDRIRENILKYKNMSANDLINLSINETLSRTILTIFTTLIACLALIIFGGSHLHSFSIVVFIGIVIGTYSSIYVSAPILINLGINKYFRQ